ncbi:MAG: hypothetical protein ACI39U_04525 [Candidatus Cryptobacteroides sp.]
MTDNDLQPINTTFMKKSFAMLAAALLLLPLFSCTKENQLTVEKLWVASAAENADVKMGDIKAEYYVLDLSDPGKCKLGIVMTQEMAEGFNKTYEQEIAKANDIFVSEIWDVTVSASGKTSGSISMKVDDNTQTLSYSKMTRTFVEMTSKDDDGETITVKLYTPKSLGLKLGDFIAIPDSSVEL